MAPGVRGDERPSAPTSHMSNHAGAAADDAPPSTLAAHLVSNISHAGRPDERADLQQLLTEVSALGDAITKDTPASARLAYHHKLIYVIARSVLEPLGGGGGGNSSGLFRRERDLPQAEDGLNVLIETVCESPHVVAHVPGGRGGTEEERRMMGGACGVPLWLWLFPRVLALVGRRECAVLQGKIGEFFVVVFEAVAKTGDLWGLARAFFCYLQHCADAILSRCQDPDTLVQGAQSVVVTLPLRGFEDVVRVNEGHDLYAEGRTYSLIGVHLALCHADHLLSLLLGILSSSTITQQESSLVGSYTAWLLDGIAETHRLQSIWQPDHTMPLTSTASETSIDDIFKFLTTTQRNLSEAIIEKGYHLLGLQIAAVIQKDPNMQDADARILLCKMLVKLASMCAEYPTVARLITTGLVDKLDTSMVEFPSDLDSCFKILRDNCAANSTSETYNDIQDVDLCNYIRFHKLTSSKNVETSQERPSKRRKITREETLVSEIGRKTNELLKPFDLEQLEGLQQEAASHFERLGTESRSQALHLLGLLPCAAANTLTAERDEKGRIAETRCSVCDADEGPVPPFSADSACDESTAATCLETLRSIISLTDFESSRKARVMAMLAVKRLAMHSNSDALIRPEDSHLGQWCFRSLNSSMRELRIVAGRTIPVFVRQGLEEFLEDNWRWSLDTLRALSDKSPVHFLETFVLAWGQLGRVSANRELNLVLHRLVEYLGHSNQIVSSVAFNEILSIAESFGMPVGQMFSPFWRSLGHMAVKDLQNRPQTAQLVADLMSMTVSELLVRTQTFTLPWLVLTKKRDVILRIAQARKDDEPWRTFMESSNLRAIMALLLIQNVPDLESFVMDLLHGISPHFKSQNLDLTDLLKAEPIGIALELLKNAGEEDESKKSRVRHALQILATRTQSGDSSRSSKKGSQVGAFLEQHTLGIMSDFTDLLNDTRGWQSAAEKRRALKGIEEMLQVGKNHIRTALPQISACLQSALGNADLRSTAFAAWATMTRSLEDEDVGSMLEDTFSTIVLRWETFDDASHRRAADLITYLLKKRSNVVRAYIQLIPALDHIPELETQEKALAKLRETPAVRQAFQTLSSRLTHEHASVVTQALMDLAKYLQNNQAWLQASAVSEQPDFVVGELVRNILDACIRFNGSNTEIARLSAECIGLVGCLDSNRVESVRERREMVVISNFEDPEDTTDFVLFVLEEALVKAFLSATNPRAQGFLSYAMQELLEKCDFRVVCASRIGRQEVQSTDTAQEHLWQKWQTLSETAQSTLTPFLKSRYVVTEMVRSDTAYPIFKPEKSYSAWLRSFVLSLLEEPRNENSILVFEPLCRVIRIQDTSVANFLLPYAVLHAIALGTDLQREQITQELYKVLAHVAPEDSHIEQNTVKQCSEAVFRVLDYSSRWVQAKQANLSRISGYDSRWSRGAPAPRELGVERVNALLAAIPAEVVSRRAVECKSYARALFHWELHIRQSKKDAQTEEKNTALLERLQEIYTQIDEPDGIEGISEQLQVLDIDQQMLGHRRAGRWAPVQNWYEIKLAEDPSDADVQMNLLHCLKESGQHDVLLNHVEGMQGARPAVSRILPFAIEASWATGRWESLKKYVSAAPLEIGGDFNVNIGRVLLTLNDSDAPGFSTLLKDIRENIAGSLSVDTTASLNACHDSMLKLHVLTELEMITRCSEESAPQRKDVLESLDRRLEAIGAYLNDKQYLLGIRRAAMQLSQPFFSKLDVAAAWLTSARLARKGNSVHQSFNAVLHASKLGDESATIENARLLWKGGNSRKAIQMLQGAIKTNAFMSHNSDAVADPTLLTTAGSADHQNLLTARAHLLLAKWLDSAGQTNSGALRSQYQHAVQLHMQWEKGHYYLGRHYTKLMESEKLLASNLQTAAFLAGETARLVIENYLRALNWGVKYVYQTLPRILTLWLDLGTQVLQPVDAKLGNKDFATTMLARRKDQLSKVHTRFSKYISKMPAYIFYTALPQIVARITHANNDVYKYLQLIIIKVVQAYPQQALWTLFAVSASANQPERKQKGASILANLRGNSKKQDIGAIDIKSLIRSGEKLADELLKCCSAGEFRATRTVTASLTKDLGFNTAVCTPNMMAVPIESTLAASLPTLTDNMRTHRAFSRETVTITGFSDEVLVLSSLQKPRKLTALGSDGKQYGLMCKPKDDLRKDQRLMEFNSMINRSLKRDAESSKRQLYIKTYAVTPLNEECGIIEWVDGLKTLRDILLNLYKMKGISPNYGELKAWMDEACKSDEKLVFFTEKVLGNFPPVFHTWFVQQFPEPSAWFNARLKYTRSAAVMSMIGTILGLGDRHGENILFEEGNGGTFHVDFNCLFDKGLTFNQPEKVPFRLTHNMVDAMGVYGTEGPFRKSSELTLKILRQHEETLMTIMEAFVHDPTLDLVAKNRGKKKPEREGASVPDTPQGVLDSIKRKVGGLLPGESVPLGVEGQVDELIKQAVSAKNLAAMYIGWSPFF